MKQMIKGKGSLILLCFLAVFLEFFVFNYRHWESLTWQEEHVLMQEWLIGEGLTEEEPLTYRVTEEPGEETATVELLNINKKLHNIHVSLEIVNPQTASDSAVNIQLKMTDAANAKYFRLPVRDILTEVPKSEYIRLHLSGETKEALLIVNASPGDLIKIHDISGNVRVPFFFSLGRLLAVMALLLGAFSLRPASGLHKVLYLKRGLKGNVLLAAVLVLELLAAGKVCRTNLLTLESNRTQLHTQQYQLLAHSLAEGKTWLDAEPDEFLEKLSNPYDYRLRSMTMANEGGTYLWDAAYYEGRYYVYFGIVPELVFFLPYYLVTGQDLPVMPVVLLLGALFILGIFVLMDQVVKRWYPRTPLTVYLLLSLLIVNGCGLWSYFRNPTFYEIPILSAMALGAFGLAFWLGSVKESGVSRGKLALGSLCMALIAGCRPQLLLLLLLAGPIFWESFLLTLKSKENRKELLPDALCFALPILAVAIGIMYYNFIRFGSVTDFGANYNLTLQDMTHREIDLGRTVFGFFTVLFQPPYMTGVFPYFEQVKIESQFYGQTILEAGFGGVAATNLILCISLIPFCFRRFFEKREAYVTACMFSGFAAVIAFFDIQIGGLIPRYLVDFTWLLFLTAALILLGVGEKLSHTQYWKTGWRIFLLLFAQSSLFQFLTIFTDVYGKVKDMNPLWFYEMEHLIEFWL